MSKLALSTLAILAVGIASMGCAATPIPVLYDGLDQPRFTRCLLRPDKQSISSSNYVGSFGGYPPGSKVAINMFSPQRVDLTVNKIPHQLFPADGEFNAGDIEGFLDKYFVNSLSEIGIEDPDAPAAKDPTNEGNPLADPLSEYPEDGSGGVEGPDGPDGPDAGNDGAAAEPVAAGWRLDLMKSSTASSVKQGIAAVGMTKEEIYMALGPPIFVNFGSPATQLNLETIMDSNRWVYYNSWAGRAFTFGIFSKKVFTFDGTHLTQVE